VQLDRDTPAISAPDNRTIITLLSDTEDRISSRESSVVSSASSRERRQHPFMDNDATGRHQPPLPPRGEGTIARQFSKSLVNLSSPASGSSWISTVSLMVRDPYDCYDDYDSDLMSDDDKESDDSAHRHHNHHHAVQSRLSVTAPGMYILVHR